MAEINRLSGLMPVLPVDNNNDKLLDKKIKRMVLKEHQKEALIEHQHEARLEDESIFQEIAGFFANESQRNTLEQTRSAVPQGLLDLYEANFSDAAIASDSLALTYLSSEEVQSFLDYIDVDGKKKEKFEKLASKLASALDGEEEGLIDDAARQICQGNKAEIYLMLSYLYEDLLRKNVNEEMKERLGKLKKILDAFERQESAYLFNFFSLSNVLSTSPNQKVSSAFMDNMANISSGNVRLASLRQTLQFIIQNMPNDKMYKMVSMFMKFQAKNLKKISTLNEGRESKEELSNILQQERNLIIINSLYNQCRRLLFCMKKVTPVEEKYGELMTQFVNVIETSLITTDTVQQMQKVIGLKQVDLETNKAFIKQMYHVLSKMPQQIYVNEALRDKILETLRNIMRHIEKLQEPKSGGLSFLRRKVDKIRNA